MTGWVILLANSLNKGAPNGDWLMSKSHNLLTNDYYQNKGPPFCKFCTTVLKRRRLFSVLAAADPTTKSSSSWMIIVAAVHKGFPGSEPQDLQDLLLEPHSHQPPAPANLFELWGKDGPFRDVGYTKVTSQDTF
ncbi:hypothetical protein VTL71DRAFT_15290 [Oculimacula yallundae]|uniref:Uncharacterized protein n=1 Tax=Oculimacula yallundae TaxID=86028 RepID=A0ABR4CGW1_9HELO